MPSRRSEASGGFCLGIFQEQGDRIQALFRSIRYTRGQQARGTRGNQVDVPVIWVISPHPNTQQMIGLNLSKRGLRTVQVAADGLELADAKPDLVILDVEPPDELGGHTTRCVREMPELQGVPLVLILADAPSTSRLKPLEPVRWVKKPLSIGSLLAAVQESLTQQGRRYEMNSSRESLADRVRATPGGEHLYMCYSCGTCVGKCPIQSTGELTYNPRRLIQKVINGLEQEAFEDRTTWLCSACDLCYSACPQEIHISGVLQAVRDLAVQAGHITVLQSAKVNEWTCVACGLCVEVCPYEATSLVEKRIAGHTRTMASVDPNRCMACGLCTASCRSASIELVDQFSNEAVMEEMWEWLRRPQPVSVPATQAVAETEAPPAARSGRGLN
jgi:heterodisulfide reductase subunit C